LSAHKTDNKKNIRNFLVRDVRLKIDSNKKQDIHFVSFRKTVRLLLKYKWYCGVDNKIKKAGLFLILL
jgi:hypothetical protein